MTKRRPHTRSSPAATAVVVACAAWLCVLAWATPASAGDSTGYYYGSDSNDPAAVGRSFPYRAAGTGGRYGGYVGEVGTWTNWRGCTTGLALNPEAVREANADEQGDGRDRIPGVFFYWFSAGPGADPHYNGTAAEAYSWGVAQAKAAVAGYADLAAQGLTTDTTYIPLMFMDIETQPLAGYANGWNERVNACGQITRAAVIPPAVDRATFDGFYDYLHVDTIFRPGVYSTPDFWAYTFGTGPDGSIPNTYQWTPVSSTGRVQPDPQQFCQSGRCAQWFGDVRRSREAGWQWDQNGGDYDQWNTADLPR